MGVGTPNKGSDSIPVTSSRLVGWEMRLGFLDKESEKKVGVNGWVKCECGHGRGWRWWMFGSPDTIYLKNKSSTTTGFRAGLLNSQDQELLERAAEEESFWGCPGGGKSNRFPTHSPSTSSIIDDWAQMDPIHICQTSSLPRPLQTDSFIFHFKLQPCHSAFNFKPNLWWGAPTFSASHFKVVLDFLNIIGILYSVSFIQWRKYGPWAIAMIITFYW